MANNSTDQPAKKAPARLTTMAEGDPTDPAPEQPDELTQLRAEVARLTAENERLRQENEELRAGQGVRQPPTRPSFRLSEGERADLEQSGVTTSPWTGERLTASDEGVEPANEDARRADEKASREPADRDEPARADRGDRDGLVTYDEPAK